MWRIRGGLTCVDGADDPFMRLTKRTLVPLRQSPATRRVRPDKSWAVYFPSANEKGLSVRHRRFFRHREEAEAFCSVKRAEIASLGAKAGALSDELKAQALICSELLSPTGVQLVEAVRAFLKDYRAAETSVTVRQAMEALLSRTLADGLSDRHRLTISSIIKRFAGEFGERKVTSIRTEELQAWLDSRRTPSGGCLLATSLNSYRSYLGLFFSFCCKRGWAETNPVDGIRVTKVKTKVPRLMAPSDLRTMLANAPIELRPILSLQALCGLRVAEAARLRWEDVLLKPTGNYVQIGANNAKTARRRLTPMPDGLANYLARVRQPEGFVCASAKGSVNSLQYLMADLRKKLPNVAWARNGLRASALSYRLALTKDAAATAFEMGNSPSVLMRDYRELTTPTQAIEWFSVEVQPHT